MILFFLKLNNFRLDLLKTLMMFNLRFDFDGLDLQTGLTPLATAFTNDNKDMAEFLVKEVFIFFQSFEFS
jgi:hypothetical protein